MWQTSKFFIGGLAMIYGIGTTYDSSNEKLPEFVASEVVCVGWTAAASPAIHQLFGQIGVGDIVFAKSFPPSHGLFIKGVGVVTSAKLFDLPKLGVARHVHWIWSALEGREPVRLGRIDDHYDYFRGGTLYQELGPRVQDAVLAILFNGSPITADV
jgi:hypothetical protein